MLGWPWAKIYEVSTAVQAYHHDLAGRLFTGKSGALEEARKEAAHAQALAAVEEEGRRSGLGRDQIDAARAAAEARAFAREVAGLRFAVNADPEPAVARLDGPAIFAAVREARARGATPAEVQAIVQAGMAGRPIPPPGGVPGGSAG